MKKLPKEAEFHRNETSGYAKKDVLFVRLKSTHLDRRVGFIFCSVRGKILYEILTEMRFYKRRRAYAFEKNFSLHSLH